jgi:tryptophan synthase alpha chain
MTHRIDHTFDTLRNAHEKAFVAYLTAGDPDLEATGELILALDRAGVDILEIGVPFSDPTADGPVIQAAAQRSLAEGTTLAGILDMIESIRHVTEIPIVLFGYYNPILSFGPEQFARRAVAAGVDGILVVDLPPEESRELRQFTDPHGLDFISLIAPTTSAERTAQIAKDATGFLYYISITGVTGTATPRITDISKEIHQIRGITDMPVVVGFGISTPRQAREIAWCADGIVIGSAFVQLIADNGRSNNLVKIVTEYAKDIKAAVNEAC